MCDADFGEITLWVGMYLVCVGGFSSLAQALAALLSPLFTSFLLTRVSGIPLLERAADKKWAGDVDYEWYKQHTPVLLPRLWPAPRRR